MPRNISFALTTQQIRDRTKDVTRRLGWLFLSAGERLHACVKCQGLRPGEAIERLALIEVVSVRREPLDSVTQDDVRREGFHDMTTAEFVEMFCEHMGCERQTIVTRIEFRYVDDPGGYGEIDRSDPIGVDAILSEATGVEAKRFSTMGAK